MRPSFFPGVLSRLNARARARFRISPTRRIKRDKARGKLAEAIDRPDPGAPGAPLRNTFSKDASHVASALFPCVLSSPSSRRFHTFLTQQYARLPQIRTCGSVMPVACASIAFCNSRRISCNLRIRFARAATLAITRHCSHAALRRPVAAVLGTFIY